MEILIQPIKRVKLTVSQSIFTIKYPENYSELQKQRIENLSIKIKKELTATNINNKTYRGQFSEKGICLKDGSARSKMFFKF